MTKTKAIAWGISVILLLTMLAGMQVRALAQTVNLQLISTGGVTVRNAATGDELGIAPRNQRVNVLLTLNLSRKLPVHLPELAARIYLSPTGWGPLPVGKFTRGTRSGLVR